MLVGEQFSKASALLAMTPGRWELSTDSGHNCSGRGPLGKAAGCNTN